MNKVIRFGIILMIITLAAFGCTRGEYPNQQEPSCKPEITIDEYDQPARLLLGIGRGALAASRLRGQQPERFDLLAGVGGPISFEGLLELVEQRLLDFDNLPETLERGEWIEYFEELFQAFGNPLYENPDSKYYPPGTTAEDFPDFDQFVPKTVYGVIDPVNNPDGTLPAVTFADQTELVISFALALDENENGVRDQGEPILMNIAGSTVAQTMLAWDPAVWPEENPIENEWNFPGSIYTDIGRDNPFGFSQTNETLFERLLAVAPSREPVDNWCIQNYAATYNSFFWDDVFPDLTPFVPERFIWANTNTDDLDLNLEYETLTSMRATRMLQALYFLSARTPNWYKDREDEKDSDILYEENVIESASGYSLTYFAALPAGYNQEYSMWKTYPMVYVFPAKGTNPDQWQDLAAWQGWLAHEEYGQQMILIVLDPDADYLGTKGYSYFVGPAHPTAGQPDAGAILDEIITHAESKYRGRTD